MPILKTDLDPDALSLDLEELLFRRDERVREITDESPIRFGQTEKVEIGMAAGSYVLAGDKSTPMGEDEFSTCECEPASR